MALKASIRYTASCSIVVMDEVASLNERVDNSLEQRREEGAMTMEERLENKQEGCL